MFTRLLFSLLLILGFGNASAQLDSANARLIVESLLSTQNPLVVVEEIAHDGLNVRPAENGYVVTVASPRLPGRVAFGEGMEVALIPQSTDLVQVLVSDISTRIETDDGGQLSFSPTLFNGVYSFSAQGFEMLQLGIEDLTYIHSDGQFSLSKFELDASIADGIPTLSLSARGFSADFQDVMDFQETVGSLDLNLSFANGTGQVGDLLHLSNRVFEMLVNSGAETTNLDGKARALTTDWRGLTLDFALTDWNPRWMALRDAGSRDMLSDTRLGNIVVRAEVIEGQDGMADLAFNFTLNDFQVSAPDDALTAQAQDMTLSVNLGDLPLDALANLLSDVEGAQSAALSQIVGSVSSLEVQGSAGALNLESIAEVAHLNVEGADFNFAVAAPYAGAPNVKDVTLNTSVVGLDGNYPSVLEALEPAWSNLLQPALPDIFDLRLAVRAVPAEFWLGLAGMFVDTDQFPTDVADASDVPTLTLDGSRYVSDLTEASIDGTLMLSPGASLLAVGGLRLELTNLRPMIGAMQRSARVPDRTIAQFLTLGSVGLATITGFAERTDSGSALFNFEFQQDGFPTINGRPLPIGF